MRQLIAALALWFAVPLAAQTPVTVAGLQPERTAGMGADVPFLTYEAEDGATDGTVIGPDRTFGTLAAEASGRRAVMLDRAGKHLSITLAAPANALVVRYAVPDAPDGRGVDARIELEVDGTRLPDLTVTSRYGWFYGRYPFTNRPADGGGHHFFDHTRVLLDRTLPAGSIVRLALNGSQAPPWIAIDLVDAERVAPPLPRPPGSLSVTDLGADPTGIRDATATFRRALVSARRQGRVLWVPPGTYAVHGHLTIDRQTVAGAGLWHSVLRGRGVGFYGRSAPPGSKRVMLSDLAIIGEVDERVDSEQLSGVGGAMGGGSRIERLWIQHVKVGLWFDGPMDGITVSHVRIVDVTADGLNFHRGVRNAVMEHGFVRGSGDDGLAAWSGGAENANIVFRRNTVIAPVLANGIAVYGGRDGTVSGNVVADTVTQGGGLHFGNRFSATPLAGTHVIARNVTVRAGSFDPNWRHGVGALWFYALDHPIDATIKVRNLRLIDSSEGAVLFIGKRIDGVSLSDIAVEGAAGAIDLRAGGSATVANLKATGLSRPAILRCDAEFNLYLAADIRALNSPAAAPCGPTGPSR